MHQLNLVASCIAWIFSLCAITSVVVSDDNAIIELAFKNYYKAINMTGTLPGCRPNIVTGPLGSMIQPVNGHRARVALIVDPGTCEIPNNFSFVCIVFWDANSEVMTKQIFPYLSPCHLSHQYMPIDQSYNVTAEYCLVSPSGDAQQGCCDMYTRVIDVSEF